MASRATRLGIVAVVLASAWASRFAAHACYLPPGNRECNVGRVTTRWRHWQATRGCQ